MTAATSPDPNFSFGGRVHTNQNLFLAAGADLVFNDKIAAFPQIIMDQLENGHAYHHRLRRHRLCSQSQRRLPSEYVPAHRDQLRSSARRGHGPGRRQLERRLSQHRAARPMPISPASLPGTLNGFLTNSLTGAKNMQLPFVQNSCTSNPPPCTDPIAIIRKPQPGESATSALGSSRLYNKAADSHPAGRHASRSSSRARSYRRRGRNVNSTPAQAQPLTPE